MNPIVSVLIACYNVHPFLNKNIQLVINQTLAEIEIILVNDGSTDMTPTVCDQLAQTDPRIKVIHHKENKGLGAARNSALDIATGKYIYFYDIDDEIPIDLLDTLTSLADENQSEILIFGMEIFDIFTKHHDKMTFPDLLISSNQNLKQCFVDTIYFKKHGNGFVCNKFYLREFILRSQVKFGDQRVQQDEIFNLNLYKYASRILLNSMTGYKYFLYPNCAGRRYTPTRFEAVTSIFSEMKKFLIDWNFHDPRFTHHIYTRYKSAIINALCFNNNHSDCKLSFCEKYQSSKKHLRCNEVRECVKYLKKSSTKGIQISMYWTLVKYNLPLLLTLTSYCIETAKKCVKKYL